MPNDTPDQKLKDLAPNQQTKFSAIVNGILNGGTIGSIPMVGATVWAEFGKKNGNGHHQIPGYVKKLSYASTVAGVAFGALYGLREAERIKEYRAAIANEIGELEDRISSLEAEKKAALQQNPNGFPDSKVSNMASQGFQTALPATPTL